MLNPITFTENVISDFLRYQITTYPFADTDFYAQMRALLNLEETRNSPLLRGPYISLSRTFDEGTSIDQLVDQEVLHPYMRQVAEHPNVYGHQETAIRAIVGGRTTLVSTGTGSGKTETFLYPIISHCLYLRDRGAPAGIAAVIIYPMNALAEDQLGRLRGLLAGTGITFGMYIGKTPEAEKDITGVRLKPGSSKADYFAKLEQVQVEKRDVAVHPPEERVSRDELRHIPPRILLTNVKQLELLLTRQRDLELFDNATLDFLVCDEAHTFSGAAGAETACLIRRLRTYCGKNADETVCVATSATIVDPERGADAGRDFAERFFGVSGADVELISEQYRPDIWANHRVLPPALSGDPAVHLRTILDAIDANDGGSQLRSTFQAMTGQRLDPARLEASLYEKLTHNDLVYHLVRLLETPRSLHALTEDMGREIGRPVSEEEVLLWLALGAESRQDGRPLVRPVVHSFVRGVDGAVVTFPADQERPRLWLSAMDAAMAETGQAETHYRLPVTTCTTCGQHYFVHHLEDFHFTADEPEGGQKVDNRRFWQAKAETLQGSRAVLLDRLITDDTVDAGEDIEADQPRHSVHMWLCRHCGALHPFSRTRCDGCGRLDALVPLFVVRQDIKHPSFLNTCVACGTTGRRDMGGYREPARPVRAVTVSDVHVLAQNMIQRAERKRLLVFADNRQDAAFQAGWMRDHARRFRLRSLMYDSISSGPISVGDLTFRLDTLLDKDDSLSHALLPEVWRAARKEASGTQHAQERRHFLRIQILRELTTGVKQRLGLEAWGRIQVQYLGLSKDLPVVVDWAPRLQIAPSELVDGIAALLDTFRRNVIVLDREFKTFTKILREGTREVQRGYIPLLPNVPVGMKLQRQAGDSTTRVRQVYSEGGKTLTVQKVKRWGVPKEDIEKFLNDLWRLWTTELAILAPSTLFGWNDKPLAHCAETYQIDADRLRIAPHRGVYVCNVCRRRHPRKTPRMACMAHNCGGTLSLADEKSDDYDLMVLDQQFELIRPREHSGQVPATERETIERIFKSDSEMINTLVCTPTLELGVDIGALDSVLMRNVPPLPANYWQRAGRAGRRHRMAVNVTYARPASHDRAYFVDPLKLMQGVIHPPRINLRNEVMVAKHAHATILTLLFKLTRLRGVLPEQQRVEIEEVLHDCLPSFVHAYLFSDGNVREKPLDVSGLGRLIEKHEGRVLDELHRTFRGHWPEKDSAAVSDESLVHYVRDMGNQLVGVIDRLWRRLQWALSQMARLENMRLSKGVLEPDEKALYDRCNRLVSRLKGTQRRKSQAEGYDDTYTYGVLAAEGFLPGYGLDTGAVVAIAQASQAFGANIPDFDLPRAPGVALREYVPGNLIYANGNEFVPRFYHLEPDGEMNFQVDVANEAVSEIGVASPDGFSTLAQALPAVQICDVDMPHQSYINDEEEYRFQMGVSTYGHERNRHNGGVMYHWNKVDLSLRRALHLRLVNVGAAKLVPGGTLGYPVCRVCGQSRSPLSSEAEVQKFRDNHMIRCGRPVENIGFYADIIADALTFHDISDNKTAFSIVEAIRIGASHVIDMETEDLQLLRVGRPGKQTVDLLLYDPMPGGSGLLDQVLERWESVIEEAVNVVVDCTSQCDVACIDCLLSFRNAHYHRFLDRYKAIVAFEQWGDGLTQSHEIPPLLPSTASKDPAEMPVNEAEQRLHDMLLRAGFPEPVAQRKIDFGHPHGGTIPDFYYPIPNDIYEGICIYLDGMSKHIHGNERTQQRDKELREMLQNEDYFVIAIRYTELADRVAMTGHFKKLGRVMLGKERAREIADNPVWYDAHIHL